MKMAIEQMARELTKSRNLRFVGISPGKMKETGMSREIDEQVQKLRGWTPEEALAYWKNGTLMTEEAHPMNIAWFIYHLIQNPLVDTMSGTVIELAG